MKNKILIVFLCLILSGCGWFRTEPIEVMTNPEDKVSLNLPDPKPIRLTKLQWIIITPENYKEVFAKLEAQGIDTVIFGLTDRGYEELAVNLATIKQFMVEQGATLKAYKAYYEPKIYYAPDPKPENNEE